VRSGPAPEDESPLQQQRPTNSPCPSPGLAALSAVLKRDRLLLASGLSLSNREGIRQTEAPASSRAQVGRKNFSRSPGRPSCHPIPAPLLPGEFGEVKKRSK